MAVEYKRISQQVAGSSMHESEGQVHAATDSTKLLEKYVYIQWGMVS